MSEDEERAVVWAAYSGLSPELKEAHLRSMVTDAFALAGAEKRLRLVVGGVPSGSAESSDKSFRVVR